MTVIVERPAEHKPVRHKAAPVGAPEVIVGLVLLAILTRGWIAERFDGPAMANWSTMFVSVCVQAFPFLVLGVVVSAAISALVPADAVTRFVPRRPMLAVPAACAAGLLLPGCECGSVPIAGRLVSRGVPGAAALTFLLAAPAINPVVIVATAVAFPGEPMMAVARVAASALAASTVGWIWAWRGNEALLGRALHRHDHDGPRLDAFVATLRTDFTQAGGFLVLGAALAATLQTVVPRSVLDSVAGSGVLAIATMATLAVLLAVCSEADAFVAAGLSQFSLTSRLVFLTVGPMVDVKLVALQTGTFGRSFAMRFAPLTLLVAVGSATLVGGVLL